MKTNTLFLFLIFFYFLFFSCKNEEPIKEQSDFEFTVVNSNDKDFNFSWDETKFSNFENYTIVISGDPIPQNDIQNNIIPNVEILETINKQDVTSIDISILPIDDQLYFQIFATFGNRIRASNQVNIQIESVSEVDVFPSEVYFNPSLNSIYIYDDFKDRLTRYNYQTKTIEAEIDKGLKSLRGGIENYNGTSELYVVDQTNNVFILNANTLETNATISPGIENVYSVETNDKGLIIMSVRQSSMPIQIYSRESLELLNSLELSNFSNIRGIVMLSKNQNKGVEISPEGIHSFQLDDDGLLIDHQSVNSNFSSTDYLKTSVSPNGNYFITTSKGIIFNKELDFVGELFDQTSLEFADFIFSEDETIIYALSIGFGELGLVKISYPELEILESTPLEYQPIKLFLDSEKIIIIGRKFENDNTFIQSFFL